MQNYLWIFLLPAILLTCNSNKSVTDNLIENDLKKPKMEAVDNSTKETIDMAEQIDEQNSDIINKYWKLIELGGQSVEVLESMRKEPHFMLKIDSSVTGHGGCNAFYGKYEILEGNKLRIFELGSTEMYCINNKIEDPFVKMLLKINTYSYRNDTLKLSISKTAPLAVFKAIYF